MLSMPLSGTLPDVPKACLRKHAAALRPPPLTRRLPFAVPVAGTSAATRLDVCGHSPGPFLIPPYVFSYVASTLCSLAE